jgi:metal-sulfur cluster biosynthetic enzyme
MDSTAKPGLITQCPVLNHLSQQIQHALMVFQKPEVIRCASSSVFTPAATTLPALPVARNLGKPGSSSQPFPDQTV